MARGGRSQPAQPAMRRRVAVVAVEFAELGREGGEAGEHIGGEEQFEAGELRADGMVEGEFEARQDVCVEPCVVELRLGERDEIAPLVAQAEHVGDERFAVGEVAVAMEEEIAQGGVEVRVVIAEQEESMRGRPRGGAGRRRLRA
jgi:hypothetical protein